MEKKKTLIIGASTNPARYSFKAAHMLTETGHPIVNLGVKKGEVAGAEILPPGSPVQDEIDTITLYVGPALQKQYYQYILDTKPKRVIFNPGTENEELIQKVEEAGIEPVVACTLVLLSTGQY